ncbi:MAG: 2-hydroxyacyl-CoA dehydratase family protein [Oscillospiraceae bacterium]
MAEYKNNEHLVLSGEMSIVDFYCDKVAGSIERMKAKNPDLLWTLEIQKFTWDGVRDAHKNGKKIVAFGGSMPVEIFAAFDCVPFYLDIIPFRTCTNVNITGKYIDEAEKFVSASMCGLDKTELGACLCGAYGFDPDIFVYSSVPCDSSRVAYPAMEKILNIPTFSFDLPFRRDERGAEYLASQVHDLVDFMEKATGTKCDWEKMKHFMEISNKVFDLQAKCADLRKKTPCPLPGRFLVLNGTTNAYPCFPEMLNVYEHEYEAGLMMAELGIGACPDEKYRVAMLQNMIWGNSKIMDWMEQTYNAVAVMDAFGFQGDLLYEHPDDRHDCYKVMARRMQNNPMIHGASGPSECHLKMVEEIFEQYSPNVSMFLGHIGCKHTWASSKMLTDMIQEKYGLPTLFVDLDAIDGRYKSGDDIMAEISQYMETVVMR